MFVISDLDGTLALLEHRLHYIKNGRRDWPKFFDACDQDEPNWPVINAVLALDAQPGNRIEIWSGRSDAVRAKTGKWLADVGLGHLPLKMRAEGDFTPDDELKESWLHAEPVAPDLIFDDRASVVQMWRRNGIICAQVAPGNF